MTLLAIIFISSFVALAGLFALAFFESRVGRRFGGTRRKAVDAVLHGCASACQRALATDSRSRARAFIARCSSDVIEQFSRVRAPGGVISQRATRIVFSSRRALAVTSTASPFLRKMAGYKEKVEGGK